MLLFHLLYPRRRVHYLLSCLLVVGEGKSHPALSLASFLQLLCKRPLVPPVTGVLASITGLVFGPTPPCLPYRW